MNPWRKVFGRYPLKLVAIPESTGYYSKGHHGGPEFCEALAREYGCKPKPIDPLGFDIILCWWRVNPPQKHKLHRTVQEAKPGSRGTFPVTVVYKTVPLAGEGADNPTPGGRWILPGRVIQLGRPERKGVKKP